ncbi:MAG: uridine diphosphate-N-acetylglucosamine-binding protein YvcK [candidate division WS1 bacterium]|nr:uridine diphosphate-N-acetylglucosamine-binding protein YvcK [candidate division WS1 bacterium]
MRTALVEKLPRPLRWLYPGLHIKRWYALMLLGIALLSVGVLLLFNLNVYDLVALVGPGNEKWAGVLGIVLGLAVVALAVRGVVRSIAKTFLPAEEGRLVDIMLSQRRSGGLNMVAIGGGTGLATLLRGLKVYTENLSAVVTVADGGGSSGRLRDELGILPPGDVRNCLVALADSEPLMTRLFEYRFAEEGGELGGHSFGNLLIAALSDISGNFLQALRDSRSILAIHGQVLPPTLERVTLCAKLKQGGEARGETAVAAAHGEIEYAYLDPPAPAALPEAVEALHHADMVVIGPGSIYTSIIPNLLVPQITQTLREIRAARVYVCNVMTQPGETDNFSAVDHVQAILQHVDNQPLFDYVLLNTRRPSAEVVARYESEGAQFVDPDERGIARLDMIPVCRDLIAEGSWARHDPAKLATAIMQITAEHKTMR